MDRGKWSQQDVPHKGWQICDFTDLEDLVGTCEMCETQSIRYVHYMEHSDYGAVLGVGRVCAGHMEEDYKAAQERERQAKSIANRRTRWLKAQWKKSATAVLAGSLYQPQRLQCCPVSRQAERSWSESGFATEYDAKLAAFERYVEVQE